MRERGREEYGRGVEMGRGKERAKEMDDEGRDEEKAKMEDWMRKGERKEGIWKKNRDRNRERR